MKHVKLFGDFQNKTVDNTILFEQESVIYSTTISNDDIEVGDVIGTKKVICAKGGEYIKIKDKYIKSLVDRIYFEDGTSKDLDLVNKIIKKSGIIKNYSSLSRKVNYKDKNDVKDFYNSFNKWRVPIEKGVYLTDSQIFEVIDNMILHNGEYYLATDYVNRKKTNTNGYYFAKLIQIPSSFDASDEKITHNVFLTSEKISTEQVAYIKQKTINKSNLGTIEYLDSLDYRLLDSSDLNLLCKNITPLLKNNIKFPFIEDGVKFKEGDYDRIEVIYRNRIGYLKIDNYGGRHSAPFDLKYRSMLKVEPYFTNVSYAYASVDLLNEVSMDVLISLVPDIKKRWDKAIEENV